MKPKCYQTLISWKIKYETNKKRQITNERDHFLFQIWIECYLFENKIVCNNFEAAPVWPYFELELIVGSFHFKLFLVSKLWRLKTPFSASKLSEKLVKSNSSCKW